MVAPVVPGAQAKEDGLREKIAVQKEKREMQKKLSGTVTLGSRNELDDVAAWVEKHRVMEIQKAIAVRKNKELEDVDARLVSQVSVRIRFPVFQPPPPSQRYALNPPPPNSHATTTSILPHLVLSHVFISHS